MLNPYKRNATPGVSIISIIIVLLALISLAGCLEQLQTTRIPAGALSNFVLHLRAGQLDDARAYFAPGLVTPSAQLDTSIIEASKRLRGYELEIAGKQSATEDLSGGEKRVMLSGRVRPSLAPGESRPNPDEGWQQTDIIAARMVERGPGWRILDFELKCCPIRDR